MYMYLCKERERR